MKFLFTLFLGLMALTTSYASVSSGTIDPAFKTTKICQDAPCSNAAAYYLNMAPTGVTQVTIDDTNGVDGIAWATSLGWINFDPTGPEGVTINPNTGVLSGLAWSQGGGWINFSVTNHQVAINSNGEFTGWAWNGGVGGGWIKFDCSDAQACIKTDWRPIPARPVATTPAVSGGGIVSTSADVCPNLDGVQYNVPAGYGLLNNVCSAINDVCPNLSGAQTVVPTGYVQDKTGMCNLDSIDMCANLAGKQASVPSGNTINSNGECVQLTKETEVTPLPSLTPEDVGKTVNEIDMCPNVIGLQISVPNGMVLDDNKSCVNNETDYCPNLPGTQPNVPLELVVSNAGECVPALIKLDVSTPVSNNVTPIGSNRYVLPLTPKSDMISYSFVPESVRYGVRADPIAKAFMTDEEEQAAKENIPSVDVVSIVLTLAIVLFAAYRVVKFLAFL